MPWICFDQLLQDGTRRATEIDQIIRGSEDLDRFIDKSSVKV